MSDHPPSTDGGPDDAVLGVGEPPIGEMPLEAPEADVVEQWREVPLDEDERPY